MGVCDALISIQWAPLVIYFLVGARSNEAAPVFVSGVREPLSTYAIVQTGSKQYRVQAGDNIRVESLPVYTGEIVSIDDVF